MHCHPYIEKIRLFLSEQKIRRLKMKDTAEKDRSDVALLFDLIVIMKNLIFFILGYVHL